MRKLFGIFFVVLLVACSSDNHSISLKETFEDKENNITLVFEGELNTSLQQIDKHTNKILHDSVVATVLGDEFVEFGNNKILKKYAQSLIETFAETAETAETSEEEIRLYTQIDGKFVNESEKYVTFRRIMTTNTTPNTESLMTTCNYYVFDAKTGCHLRERDIFSPREMNIMRALLVERAKEMAIQNEIEIDLYRVRPNGNFTITDSTISYIFNPYEIAHPRIGYIEITINNVKN